MSENTITRFRGDTLTPEEITVVDKDTGLPKDITGATFVMSVSPTREPTTADYLFQIVGVPNVDPLTGKVEFTLTADNADNLGNFYFDVEMTVGGADETVMKDNFILNQDITK